MFMTQSDLAGDIRTIKPSQKHPLPIRKLASENVEHFSHDNFYRAAFFSYFPQKNVYKRGSLFTFRNSSAGDFPFFPTRIFFRCELPQDKQLAILCNKSLETNKKELVIFHSLHERIILSEHPESPPAVGQGTGTKIWSGCWESPSGLGYPARQVSPSLPNASEAVHLLHPPSLRFVGVLGIEPSQHAPSPQSHLFRRRAGNRTRTTCSQSTRTATILLSGLRCDGARSMRTIRLDSLRLPTRGGPVYDTPIAIIPPRRDYSSIFFSAIRQPAERGCRSSNYLTASFKVLPAVNFGTVIAGIIILAFV